MKKYFRINLYISSVLALLIGSILLYVGLKHNSQGEFYSVESGQVDFAYIAVIFFSWAVSVFIVCVLIGAIVFLIYRLASIAWVKRGRNETQDEQGTESKSRHKLNH